MVFEQYRHISDIAKCADVGAKWCIFGSILAPNVHICLNFATHLAGKVDKDMFAPQNTKTF